VQEEELDSRRAAGERGRQPGGMRVREKPKGCLPARFMWHVLGTKRPRTNPGPMWMKFTRLSSCPSLSVRTI